MKKYTSIIAVRVSEQEKSQLLTLGRRMGGVSNVIRWLLREYFGRRRE